MNTKIIYHQVKPGTDCPDGIASAWVASLVYPCSDFEGCSYQCELPSVDGYDLLIIVDFSFPKFVLESWEKEGKKIIVIDHHKTAFENLQDLSKAITQRFDMSECGATLAWKYFFPNEKIPAFLEYVRDRDLWNFDLNFSEEIHEAIATLKYQSMPGIDKLSRTFQVFEMLRPLDLCDLQQIFAPWGYKLLEPKRRRITELAQNAQPKTLQGNRILTVEVPETESRLISDLCSELYKENPEYLYVVAYYKSSAGLNLSFRSNKKGSNFDVSGVAQSLGGGGHANAAGALISDSLFPWENG